MQTFQFDPVAGPLLIGLLMVLLVGMLWIGPSFARLSRSRRGVLTGLRGATMLLLFLALLRPGCVTTVQKRQSALMLFLVDASRSMQLPHRDERENRWAALQTALEENRDRLEKLQREQIEVRFIAFDNQTQPLEVADGSVQLPELPDGAQTDIGEAIDNASRSFRDQRLIGVVVASDGVQNATDSSVELVDSVNGLAAQEIPLYVIPFGLPADVAQLADVAITNLPDHDTVFVKNRKTVRATLVSRGFANQPVTVQLVISEPGQEEKVVDTRIYTPDQSYQEQTVELSFTPSKPGSYRMSVRAVALPNESATLNNELTSFLTVYEGGLRVLYLSSLDWWEQSRLKRAIPSKAVTDGAAAQGIEIEFFPIFYDQQTRQNSWPLGSQLTQAITNPAVDVIVINDVDARALFQPQVQETNLRAIEEAVARGKGLMMMGGTHSFGPGLYHSTPLADVLPVTMNEFDRQEFDRDIRTELHIPGPLELIPTTDHPLLHLNDEENFRDVWSQLPPLPGANRFAGVKDYAEVLLTTRENQPILIAGNYGAGRVLAFAGDSTWLWYNHGFQDEHKRFWQQVILWLAFPDGSAKDSVRVFLGQRRFQPESQVNFTSEARTVTGQVIGDAEFTATLINPKGESSPITMNLAESMARGGLAPEQLHLPGIYTIRVSARRGTEQIGTSEVELSVYDQDQEKSNPVADPQLLDRLAKQTEAFGGRTVLPEQLGELLDQIGEATPEMEISIPQRWRLGQTTWDASLLLVLFVSTLTLEWYFRKRWGLV